MDYEKMWDEVMKRAKCDPWYQECLERIRQRESAYFAVCEILSTEQKEAVEEYIAACEEIGDCMAVLAYQLALEVI